MRTLTLIAASLCLVPVGSLRAQTVPPTRQSSLSVQNSAGLVLFVAAEHDLPALQIIVPHRSAPDTAIEVLFPEHVTARKHGYDAAEQLYLFRPGRQGDRPIWRRVGRSLEYHRDLSASIQLLARATLEEDGVRFHYEFLNRSTEAYDMIYAVTDPRLTSVFHDARLERTFVHHADGFDLLAAETPGRLTLPLTQWLPARYLASFRWPIPDRRVEKRDDGITYYNKSRPVDEPFIATRSADGAWVAASFARNVGNVWSNPELTCQHVDPQTVLGPRGRATVEMKMLILRGSLDDALQRARAQRSLLK